MAHDVVFARNVFAPELPRLRSVLEQLPGANLPPRLLNVGCGAYLCARTLHGARPGWARYGLDWRAAALREAHEREPDLRLVQADARELPGLLHTRFGLVLARHPDLYRQRAAWAVILPALLDLLAPGGVLLVTVYGAEEIELLDTWALPPGPPLDHTLLAPVDLAGQDRFVLAFAPKAHYH
ncbi:MAG: class I SAM-dependent methyltransferase [Chloroflexi bacterium]|nr:class I SAM-dependent methyltransferase [Chloroflexota bacterium]